PVAVLLPAPAIEVGADTVAPAVDVPALAVGLTDVLPTCTVPVEPDALLSARAFCAVPSTPASRNASRLKDFQRMSHLLLRSAGETESPSRFSWSPSVRLMLPRVDRPRRRIPRSSDPATTSER